LLLKNLILLDQEAQAQKEEEALRINPEKDPEVEAKERKELRKVDPALSIIDCILKK
jgi:hypothetical protein